MSPEKSAEVLVVGAGPVGLTAALALTRNHVPVKVIDTGVWPCTHSYGLALHPRSVALFDELGLATEVTRAAYPVDRIALYEGSTRRGQINLREPEDSSWPLLVVRQDGLESLLEKELQRAGVDVSWRHALYALAANTESVNAVINRYEARPGGYETAHGPLGDVEETFNIEAPFVIAADGHDSRVRRALDIGFHEVAPPQYYAVFEFRSTVDLKNEMRVVFGERTTDVVWPMPDGYCRCSFELIDYSEEDQYTEWMSSSSNFPGERTKDRRHGPDFGSLPLLDLSTLEELLAERVPWFKGTIEDMRWRTTVRFERRMASSFGNGRVWLAGDAAHLAGPVGVQSMNLGLLEARDLAGALTRVLRQGAPSDELPAYGERWGAVWRELQTTDCGLGLASGLDPWILSISAKLGACLPGYGGDLLRLAGQLRSNSSVAPA